MTEKRFTLDEIFMITDNECMEIISPLTNSKDVAKVCELLNELHEEKEFWKSDACKETNENNILWNEIFIMIEQGAEPSKAFKDYMVTKKRGIVNCRFA